MANNRKRTRTSPLHSSEDTPDGLKAAIVRLRSELDAERKCIRRLRRDKAYEVQLARDQERCKAAISAKEMAAKFFQKTEQEIETLRSKHKADILKVIKQKDKEVNKIKNDLVKCQDDLKEETFRRGLSASARAAFELERSKLLQEIKGLYYSKKQVEEALCSATDTEKQRTHELRQLQERSRNAIAKINREANTEIKRLLEELKFRDQFVSVQKGNPSGTRNLAKCQQENQSFDDGNLDTLSVQVESWEKKLGEVAEVMMSRGSSADLSLQRKLYGIEKQLKHVISVRSGFTERNDEQTSINKAQKNKIGSLLEKNVVLNREVRSAKDEIRRLQDLLNLPRRSCLKPPSNGLHRQIVSTAEKKPKIKKTVRFLLPYEDNEIYPGVDGEICASYDKGGGTDKGGGGVGRSDDSVMHHSSGITDSAAVDETEPQTKQDWLIQKESLQVVIQALEEKLRTCEENEESLAFKLKELCDQNEELEFQILELENGTDEKKLQWQLESESLRSELLVLKSQLIKSKTSDGITERNVAIQCDEEMLPNETTEKQNSFHLQTDEYKLSVEAKQNKHAMASLTSEANVSSALDTAAHGAGKGLMVHSDLRNKEIEWMTQVESLKRRLSRSQVKEQHLKDQLMFLEEEKNRHIKLLQQQIELLEDQDVCSIMSTKQISKELKEAEDPLKMNKDNISKSEGLQCGDEYSVDDNRNLEVNGRCKRIITLKLDTTLNWIANADDIFSSTPSSADYNFCRNLEYKELHEDQLCRQISDLESDRDMLQEIIHRNEGVICELQSEIGKLHQSEKDLQLSVGKLEKAKECMQIKVDDLKAQNIDLEIELQQFKESENILLLNIKKLRSAELDLRNILEETVEENHTNEVVWKRKLSQVEMEKRLLQRKINELEDHVGDIEGVEIVFRQKIKKLENVESHLRKELEVTRAEYNVVASHAADLVFDKEMLVQKLEKTNLDFANEVDCFREEIEELNLEKVNIGCKVKVLEQLLASKEVKILSLETKLYEFELRQKDSLGSGFQQKGYEATQKHEIKKIRLSSSEELETSGFTRSPVTHKDCHTRNLENDSNLCVNDGQKSADYQELEHDMINESYSVVPSIPSDEVESADEASEIVDEDDGAAIPDGNNGCPDECWDLDPSSSHRRLNRLTESPSLDSICDSGLESLRQDVDQEIQLESQVSHETFLPQKCPTSTKY